MRLINPASALADLEQSVLVMHGDRDSMVPYDATVKACRGLKHVKLVTLHGADHGFVQEDDEEGLSPASVANKERIYRLVEEHLRC
jgi:dipeptidyl aminopeptidase/acylaminoacyl peptidase